MLKAYRYRLYPTEEQTAFLNRQFGSVRYVYNWAVEVATTTYQTQGNGVTRFQLDKRLTMLKQELPWLGEVASQPLQQALVHLDKAFTRFFREKRGYPCFHSKRGKQSATYPQGVKIHWKNGLLYLPKAGWIRAVFSRRFQGTVKTVTVSCVPSGQFFASVLVEDENQVPDAVAETRERAVGGDLGLHDFLVLSTGEKYGHPQWLESELYRLKILQRRFAKTVKGSKNRAKIRRQIARVHEQVANRRQDFLHKLSTDLLRRFDTVCIEDLNVAGMVRNRTLARHIAQTLHRLAQKAFRLRPKESAARQFSLIMHLDTIRILEGQMRQLDKAIARDLDTIPQTVTSIDGIGPVFGAGIVAEIGPITRFPSDDAVAKFAGLTWRAHQSGPFDAEDRPLTRSGNAYLRYYLIEAADRVRVRDPEFEAFYIRKYSDATHHPHKRALVLTARKLTGVIYGLLTRGQLYDGRRFGA